MKVILIIILMGCLYLSMETLWAALAFAIIPIIGWLIYHDKNSIENFYAGGFMFIIITWIIAGARYVI